MLLKNLKFLFALTITIAGSFGQAGLDESVSNWFCVATCRYTEYFSYDRPGYANGYHSSRTVEKIAHSGVHSDPGSALDALQESCDQQVMDQYPKFVERQRATSQEVTYTSAEDLLVAKPPKLFTQYSPEMGNYSFNFKDACTGY